MVEQNAKIAARPARIIEVHGLEIAVLKNGVNVAIIINHRRVVVASQSQKGQQRKAQQSEVEIVLKKWVLKFFEH